MIHPTAEHEHRQRHYFLDSALAIALSKLRAAEPDAQARWDLADLVRWCSAHLSGHLVAALDEVVADMQAVTGRSLLTVRVAELVEWSAAQTQQPEPAFGAPYRAELMRRFEGARSVIYCVPPPPETQQIVSCAFAESIDDPDSRAEAEAFLDSITGDMVPGLDDETPNP